MTILTMNNYLASRRRLSKRDRLIRYPFFTVRPNLNGMGTVNLGTVSLPPGFIGQKVCFKMELVTDENKERLKNQIVETPYYKESPEKLRKAAERQRAKTKLIQQRRKELEKTPAEQLAKQVLEDLEQPAVEAYELQTPSEYGINDSLNTRLAKIEAMSYPAKIADKVEYFTALLREPSAIILLAVADREVLGFAVGDHVKRYVWKGDAEYKESLAEAFYVESVTVTPRNRGQGIGKNLLEQLLIRAREAGYKQAVGHYHEGPSTRLAKKLGGTILHTNRNYAGTKETYHYIHINLEVNDDSSREDIKQGQD